MDPKDTQVAQAQLSHRPSLINFDIPKSESLRGQGFSADDIVSALDQEEETSATSGCSGSGSVQRVQKKLYFLGSGSGDRHPHIFFPSSTFHMDSNCGSCTDLSSSSSSSKTRTKTKIFGHKWGKKSGKKTVRKGKKLASVSVPDLQSFERTLSLVSHKRMILEEIARSLSDQDLLEWRLVSRRWESIASNQLRRRLTIHFFQEQESFATLSGKLLPVLTNLLEKVEEQKLLITFPCVNFIFWNHNLSNEYLQNFLNIYGTSIRELSLIARNVENPEPEDLVMDQVKYLLLSQVTNANFLELDIRPVIRWKDNSDLSRDIRSPLKRTDPEFQELSSKTYTENLTLNKNLEEVNFGGLTSSKIFEMVIRLAPNIQEVKMVENNFLWFLEPINRCHLLKDLHIHRVDRQVVKDVAIPGSFGYGKFKGKFVKSGSGGTTAAAATTTTTEWKGPLTGLCEVIEWNYCFQKVDYEVIPVTVNRVLKCCSNFLEKICWNTPELFKEFQWKAMLPNVKELELVAPFHMASEKQMRRLFPFDFSVQRRFPRLRSISIGIYAERHNLKLLLKSWNGGQVVTVKDVCISCFCFQGKQISKNDLGRVSKLFPNAKIRIETFQPLKTNSHIRRVFKMEN